MHVADIQRRLKALGFDPGKIDGVMGRATIAAVEAFQTARGLEVDGIVGFQTIDALNRGQGDGPRLAGAVPLPWLEEARRHLGLRETPGAATNSTILGWLTRLRASWRDDETAWCGTFVGICIATALPSEPLPANPFGARQWEKFGKAQQIPTLGSIGVFWRGSRSGWQGHVGFLVGDDATAYHVLGGNQGNAVSVIRMGKDRFLQARWPSTFTAPITPLPRQTLAGSLSQNEA